MITVFIHVFQRISQVVNSLFETVQNCFCVHCRPLRKMAVGMIFAALAFGAATLVEIDVVVRMSSNH